VIVEDHAADGGVMNWRFMRTSARCADVLIVVRGGEVDHFAGVAQADGREQFDFAGFEREDDFFGEPNARPSPLAPGLALVR
jgi:hypothetical protein